MNIVGVSRAKDSSIEETRDPKQFSFFAELLLRGAAGERKSDPAIANPLQKITDSWNEEGMWGAITGSNLIQSLVDEIGQALLKGGLVFLSGGRFTASAADQLREMAHLMDAGPTV